MKDFAEKGAASEAAPKHGSGSLNYLLEAVTTASDSGKKLLCPMPGLVVSIAVTEGQEVKAGETLAVVEAMKMQNVLRAERDGTVKKIHASPGATLAVDALILEFA
jgi:propionyl-CoA carboxylase alpha chain